MSPDGTPLEKVPPVAEFRNVQFGKSTPQRLTARGGLIPHNSQLTINLEPRRVAHLHGADAVHDQERQAERREEQVNVADDLVRRRNQPGIGRVSGSWSVRYTSSATCLSVADGVTLKGTYRIA